MDDAALSSSAPTCGCPSPLHTEAETTAGHAAGRDEALADYHAGGAVDSQTPVTNMITATASAVAAPSYCCGLKWRAAPATHAALGSTSTSPRYQHLLLVRRCFFGVTRTATVSSLSARGRRKSRVWIGTSAWVSGPPCGCAGRPQPTQFVVGPTRRSWDRHPPRHASREFTDRSRSVLTVVGYPPPA